jgi:glycosyltransferase involved in cell wall biosynthesis
MDLDASMKFGSLEEQMLFLARAFRDEGGRFVPVYSAPLDPESAARYRDDGLFVEGLDLLKFRGEGLRRLMDLVRTHQAEVVHWNFLSPLTNPYLWALTLRAPRVRHYYTDHNSRYEEGHGDRKWLLKWPLAQRYARILGISDFVVHELRLLHWPRLGRVYYFVNTERFRPDPAARRTVRQRVGDADHFVSLVVANLIAPKGVDVAIRALAGLPPRAVLWIAGDGVERPRLEALTAELGLGERVRFLGLQRRVEPLMQAADCLICPSTWCEAVGLVNLEAMACGVPVVATGRGGIPEYVRDGETGLLFPSGDDAALAKHLRRLLDEPETVRTLGAAARTAALEEFSPGRRVADYLDLYRIAAPA